MSGSSYALPNAIQLPRPAHLHGLDRGGDHTDPACHRNPDRAPAQPGGDSKADRKPRRTLGGTRGPRHRRGLARGGIRRHRGPVRGPRSPDRRVHRGDARAVERGGGGRVPRFPGRLRPGLLPAAARKRIGPDHRRRPLEGQQRGGPGVWATASFRPGVLPGTCSTSSMRPRASTAGIRPRFRSPSRCRRTRRIFRHSRAWVSNG